MNDDKQHAVWRDSIEKYGKETQSIVCMEECSELIQAVSKRLRGKPDATDNLAEEMADVIICLYLLPHNINQVLTPSKKGDKLVPLFDVSGKCPSYRCRAASEMLYAMIEANGKRTN